MVEEEEKTPFLHTTEHTYGHGCDLEVRSHKRCCSHTMITIALVISFSLNLVQMVITLTSIPQWSLSQNHSSPKLYSPAQSAIHLANKKFSPAFGLKGLDAIYTQPPSRKVDIAWRDLYETTLSITKAEAEQLPNKTVPLSSAPDTGYLTGLSVFHDLHCLDSIRKALWAGDKGSGPQRHGGNDAEEVHDSPPHEVADPTVLAEYRAEFHDASHLMHCVNGLRESIMCHTDIAPLSWQWSKKQNDIRVFSDVVHECRDFNSVREWARARVTKDGIDQSGWKDGIPPEVGACGYLDQGCGWN